MAVLLKDKNEIKNAFLEIINSKTQVWLFNSDWTFEENIFEQYFEVIKKLNEKKNTILEIKNPKFKDSDKKFLENHKLRYLQTQFGPPQTIALFEDKVLLIIGKEDPIAILIENKETSNRYKEYFTILWEAAKTKSDLDNIENKKKRKFD
jgi:hypothetical protein